MNAASRPRSGGFRAVVERDFLVFTSSGRFVALRTVAIAILALICAVFLVASQWERYSDRDDTGRTIFMTFFFSCPILAMLLGPPIAAAAISGERAQDTLSIVLAAPVRPWQFVAAKFLSRLFALAIPLAGAIPIAGMCFLYGGVSPDLFLQWVAFTASIAAMAIAGAIAASAFSRSTAAATLAGFFVGVVAPWLESIGAYYVAEMWLGTDAADLRSSAIFEHTSTRTFMLLVESGFRTGGGISTVLPFTAYAAIVTIVLLAVASSRVGRESAFEAASASRTRAVRRIRLHNPVADRAIAEIRPSRGRLIALAIVAGLAWLPTLIAGWDDDTAFAGIAIYSVCGFLVALSLSAQAIASERATGALAILRTTPLDADRIVQGKLVGVLATLAVLTLVVAGPLWGIAIADSSGTNAGRVAVGAILWTIGFFAVTGFASSVGLLVSASSRSAAAAAGLTFGAVIGAMILHGIAMLLIGAAGVHEEEVFAVIATISPAVSLTVITVGTIEPHGPDTVWILSSVLWLAAEVCLGAMLLRRAVAAVKTREDG